MLDLITFGFVFVFGRKWVSFFVFVSVSGRKWSTIFSASFIYGRKRKIHFQSVSTTLYTYLYLGIYLHTYNITRIPSGIWSRLYGEISTIENLCPPKMWAKVHQNFFRGCNSTKPLSNPNFVKIGLKCVRYPQSKICTAWKSGLKFTKIA